MLVEVYSDGSAQTAETPGGWAWVAVVDGVKHSEGSGHMEKATNNDAELQAAIMGLAAALRLISTMPTQEDPIEVVLVSDSQIILRWANGTQRFKQQHKMQKYVQLTHLMERLAAKTRWVRGHSGDPYNTRCDKLANWARKGIEEPKPQNQKEKLKPIDKSLIGHKKLGTISIWYKGKLKIIDCDKNLCEDYDKKLHGIRKSHLELRKD